MKIAIVKLSSIGDIAHMAFIPGLILQHLPHAKIDWFCDKTFTQILELNPHINHVYSLTSKNAHKNKKIFWTQFFSLFKIGKKHKYNVVIDIQGTFKSALIARAISTNTNTWGFKYTRDIVAKRLYKQYSHSPLTHNVHVRAIEIINSALEINAKLSDIKLPFIYAYGEKPAPHYRFVPHKKEVLIFPSSSVQLKNYSVLNFVSLIKQLNGYKITLLYGSLNEKEICNSIAQNSGVDMEIIGNKTLGEIKELLLKYSCVIGADTGILHIATGMGIPNITLYGPTMQCRTSLNVKHSVTLQGNGNVNNIPPYEIIKTLKLLVG